MKVELTIQEAELFLRLIDELDTRAFFPSGLDRRAFANSLHGRLNQAKAPFPEKVPEEPPKTASLKEK